MIAAHFVRKRFRLILIETAQHEHAVAERRQRLEDGRESEIGALA